MVYLPPGSIIAVASTAVWPLPNGAGVRDGWALCNGQAYPSGSHPLLTGFRPLLNDDRFLMGSTSFGATAHPNPLVPLGGANTKTLTASNMPMLTSVPSVGNNSVSHYHPMYTGTSGASSNTHTHSFTTPSQTTSHSHSVTLDFLSPSNTHNHDVQTYNARGGSYPNPPPPTYNKFCNTDTAASGTSPVGNTITSHQHSFPSSVSGPVNVGHTHSGETGLAGTHSHTVSATSNVAGAHTHDLTVGIGTNTPAAIENRPNYFYVVFLIRVQ